MVKHRTLTGAMAAGNELAEAEIRYRMLAEAFEELPQMRSQLNPQLERAKAEIMRLRALSKKPGEAEAKKTSGKVVPIDANRLRKSS